MLTNVELFKFQIIFNVFNGRLRDVPASQPTSVQPQSTDRLLERFCLVPSKSSAAEGGQLQANAAFVQFELLQVSTTAGNVPKTSLPSDTSDR